MHVSTLASAVYVCVCVCVCEPARGSMCMPCVYVSGEGAEVLVADYDIKFTQY